MPNPKKYDQDTLPWAPMLIFGTVAGALLALGNARSRSEAATLSSLAGGRRGRTRDGVAASKTVLISWHCNRRDAFFGSEGAEAYAVLHRRLRKDTIARITGAAAFPLIKRLRT
jgi:hypothetical protein